MSNAILYFSSSSGILASKSRRLNTPGASMRAKRDELQFNSILMLQNITLYFMILSYIILDYATLHHIILDNVILYFVILHYIILHYIIWYYSIKKYEWSLLFVELNNGKEKGEGFYMFLFSGCNDKIIFVIIYFMI